MKRIFTTALLVLATTVLTVSSCKKDEDKNAYKCETCTTTPEALAANDASSKGIYKGIIIGSSGTIKFSIQNGSNDINATLTIDGVTATLTSSITWQGGQPYVAPFTGTFNGQPVTINFSVSANGGQPYITSADIPGHQNAIFTLVKETSNALIECFEGTYTTSKPESGTFNIVLSRSLGLWGGIARENGTTDESDIDGTIENGVIKNDDGVTMGNLVGDELSGSFKDSGNYNVNFEGKRTL